MSSSSPAMPLPPDLPDAESKDSPAPPPADNPELPAPDAKESGDFFIVGIGASAGALEPISEILKRLPQNCSLAIVLVQHLDPSHHSILIELLARATRLRVSWVTQGGRIEPGNVYVAPPNSCVGMKRGALVLHEANRRKFGGDVDHFFGALAEDAKDRAVAVILSGNGTDGTAGAKAVKGAGGIVLAQEPSSAGFSSMPRSAIDAGCVDFVLSPPAIADELLKLAENAPVIWNRVGAPEQALTNSSEAENLLSILRLLASRTGVDFSEYKQTTIKRRLVRQMILSKCSDMGEYLKLLQKNRAELDRLYDSLLINVTEFFRDPEYFDFLQESVFPQILGAQPAHAPVRIWVPGCATGEEVYSLGILLHELVEGKGLDIPVQIFGTDVGDPAIAMARAGLYSANEVANVSPERLRRFFHQTDRGFLIQKPIRDYCIFARQNVVRDSPFSRLDLISCRNLLIYFAPHVQQKLMSVFHYSLNPGGFLMLGSSESVGGQADLFRLVDRRFRIYSRKTTGHHPTLNFMGPTAAATPSPSKPPSTMPEAIKDPVDVVREADRIVLGRHGPSGVLVTDELEILQFRGDVSAFLAPTAGRASLNLFRMARDGLAGELQAVINDAREKGVRVKRDAVPVVHGDTSSLVDIDVTPISTGETKERFYLVLFSPVQVHSADPAAPHGKMHPRKSAQNAQLEQLRQDLDATRSYLQAAILKHESTNQELRAANEEIQSSNEELQSTNEELETAKEELQSTNEELTTVNEELHSRQIELIQLNNDLHNLINSVHVPIVILGQDMRIRRFTPMAEKILKLIPGDIGRPLSDIAIDVSVQDLPGLIREVTESLTTKEVEVQDHEGRWFSLRLRPYKTADNKIEGVVLTLIDIDTLKRTLAAAEEARHLAEAVIETTREPLAVLTAELKIERANESFYRLFKTTKEFAQGRTFCDLTDGSNKFEELKRALDSVLPASTSLTNHELSIDLPGADRTNVVVNVRRVATAEQSYPLILLTLHPR
jgi:two-component system, chemotaxis family, CheB/CheR fusion protein